uniref:Uncharacterized protein n=2 Tax=Leersia perrieri TaxID=77586 RepID=A0A0D9XUX8_9ORYZ
MSLLGDDEDSKGVMDHLAAVTALRTMASPGLVGITQLNLFSAVCVLFLANPPVDLWVKFLVVPLPVVFLPFGLSAIMLSKLADCDDHALNYAAGFVLGEFVYVFMLGGITLAVMTEAPLVAVATVTALLIAGNVLVWRFTYKYPKCLQSGFDRSLCTPIVSSGFGSMGKNSIAEENNAKVEELVIKYPKLAKFINYSFNAFMVIEIAVYTLLVVTFFIVSEQYWQPLLSMAFVSPLFFLPLCSTSILRDAYIKKYTTEPPGSKKRRRAAGDARRRRGGAPTSALSAAFSPSVKMSLLGDGEDCNGVMKHLAAVTALRTMASSGLLGITQLNLFSTVCVLFLAKPPVDLWVKFLVVPLPVVFLPFGLSAIMLSKLADSDNHVLNQTAGFVLAEFIYVFMLGGITLAVMTEVPVVAVATVTALLIAGYGSMGKKGIVEGNDVKVEELVTKYPEMAKFINYSFNAFMVIEIAVYTLLVVTFFIVSEQCWQPLLSMAFVSPLFFLPLYSTSILRDAYIKKYTTEPPGSKK